MPKLSKKAAKQADEAEGYELLEPGYYTASLNAVTEKSGSAGPYWEWEFLCQEDAEGEELSNKSKIWENTSLSEKAIWRIAKMFEAFEVDTDTDTEELLGLHVMLHVGQEVIDGGQRQGQMKNCFLDAQPIVEDDEDDEEEEDEDEEG